MAKQITQQTLTGQAGVNLIEKRVLQMGWIWNATNIDAGIDGYIEIRDPATGRATNIIVQVQSKALSRFSAETPASFEYVCSPRDLEYWMAGNAPVILIVSRPANEEAYWVSVKDYFNTPGKRRERRVTFDKDRDKFDVNSRDGLAQVAMPRFLGVYLTPPPRTETLFSTTGEPIPKRHVSREHRVAGWPRNTEGPWLWQRCARRLVRTKPAGHLLSTFRIKGMG